MVTISLDRDIQRLQKEIKELKRKFEQSDSEHDEKLNLLSQNLENCVNEAFNTNDDLLAATLYDTAKKLVIDFLDEFKDSYSLDGINHFKIIIDDFNAIYLFAKGSGLFQRARENENELNKYKLKIEAYKCFMELANQGWQSLPVELRYHVVELAYLEEYVLDQIYEELKLCLKLIWLSVIYREPKLFVNYLKTVTLFISSIVRAYKQDHSLQEFYEKLAEKERRRTELYKECWKIINEAKSKFPYLQEILIKAMVETIELLETEIYVGNSCAMTPLGWIACNYEEVSSYCNEISLKVFDEQELSQPEIDFDNLEDF